MPYNPDPLPAMPQTNAILSQQTREAVANPSFVPTLKTPLIKPASASRKNCPQNEKVFTTQSLPDGGRVSYFAVPGRDGQRAATFFSDSKAQDLGSSQRVSYNGQRPSSMQRGNTQRYGNTQQPWAMSTLGAGELGIVPEVYESKVSKHMASLRRIKTAPGALQYSHKTRSHVPATHESDLSTVLPDSTAADHVSAWLANASRLERAVVNQMLADVAYKMRGSGGSRPPTRGKEARPATRC
eukprot:TRINITY_DN20994_c0_g1_i1.p1 TRINITY_DN20994_c0_g1~~TRINITY_DN20994_c0_g1_i1.p1  ORF type:complete len:256 (+),score=37.55 TRINITY_DN20994_c0_g1_i1:48-770(+)